MVDLAMRRPTIWRPIWAILHSFPIAFFVGALITDITYLNTAVMQWSNFSSWMIAGGLFMGGLALVAAALSAIFERRTILWKRALAFGLISIVAWLVGFANAFVHSQDAWLSVTWVGVTLSSITVALVMIASWIGFNDMAYRRVTP